MKWITIADFRYFIVPCPNGRMLIDHNWAYWNIILVHEHCFYINKFWFRLATQSTTNNSILKKEGAQVTMAMQ